MPVPEAPCWYLTPTPFIFGKHYRVLLQDPDTFLPVLAVKMVPQAVPGPRGPWEAGKGAWALRCALRETGVKYLQNMFRLTDRKPIPVNFWLYPMHTLYVRRH